MVRYSYIHANFKKVIREKQNSKRLMRLKELLLVSQQNSLDTSSKQHHTRNV